MTALWTNTASEQPPTAILVVHNGALGDFLCCWPGLLAIAHHFGRKGEDAPPLYFLGREAMRPWTLPLGYAPCPPELRAAVDSLYVEKQLPTALEGSTIFWFCLDKPPNLPCLHKEITKTIIPLPILLPSNSPGDTGKPEVEQFPPHVILNLKAHLEAYGLIWPENWRESWQAYFGAWQGQTSKEIALLPGSGHKNKEWPLHYFNYLADRLVERGWDPLFIIGETERERGLLPPEGMKWEDPSPPPALAERLRQVRAVISNDSGPAHLAGLYNIPSLVLFGPTPPETWGVPDMLNISGRGLHALDPRIAGAQSSPEQLKLNFNFSYLQINCPPCVPCTVNLRDICCPAPMCLEILNPELIWNVLACLLEDVA